MMVVPNAMGKMRIKYNTQMSTTMRPRVERMDAAMAHVRCDELFPVNGDWRLSVMTMKSRFKIIIDRILLNLNVPEDSKLLFLLFLL